MSVPAVWTPLCNRPLRSLDDPHYWHVQLEPLQGFTVVRDGNWMLRNQWFLLEAQLPATMMMCFDAPPTHPALNQDWHVNTVSGTSVLWSRPCHHSNWRCSCTWLLVHWRHSSAARSAIYTGPWLAASHGHRIAEDNYCYAIAKIKQCFVMQEQFLGSYCCPDSYKQWRIYFDASLWNPCDAVTATSVVERDSSHPSS